MVVKRRPRWLAIAFGAAALASVDAHAFDWAGLWSRPDQRAEHLLEAGNPAAAAGIFQDPRRKAYAEIEAHHYADAAQRLQPYADPLSSYNRGNALARAGHLHQALAAYDASLKRAPPQSGLYRDARHNRDLVAKQLQAKTPPSGAKGGSKSAQRGGGHGHGNGQQPPAQQSPGHPGSSPGQQTPGKQGSGKQGQSAAQPSPSQAPSQAPQGSPASAASSASSPPPPPPGATSDAAQKADAARAKQDAAAALAPRDLAGGRRSPPPRPESERAMSLDQWLRWIPDDPAGLLRRKFMIEHMLHQGKSQR